MTYLSKKPVVIAAVILLALVSSVLYATSRRRAAAVEFFTSPVTSGELRNVVNATGVVQTVVTVQVGSQVSGQIRELHADFNSLVRRGQLLATLDPRNFEAQVENSRASVAAAQARVRSAEADIQTHAANLQSANASAQGARVTLANAKVLLERAAALTAKGVTSKNELDTATLGLDTAQAKYDQAVAAVNQVETQGAVTSAQVDQAKAQLQQAVADLNRAQLNLEYTSIFSPVDGVVISRQVDVGQTLAASMQSPTLFTIATDLTRMQVSASVDEADIGSIADNAEVEFTVDAYPNDLFRGHIAEIRLNPQTVQNVVTYNVILAIANPDLKLKPGMTASIAIAVAQRDHALKIPNAALRYAPPGAAPAPARSTAVPAAAIADTPAVVPASASSVASAAPRQPLAPGQEWNPADKMKFGAVRTTVRRAATVWVLDARHTPVARALVAGITDGTVTEVVSGSLAVTDHVIIGDSSQVDGSSRAAGIGFGRGGGGGLGGR